MSCPSNRSATSSGSNATNVDGLWNKTARVMCSPLTLIV